MSEILFIGGSGEISTACVAQAVAAGHRVSVFNRGNQSLFSAEVVEQIRGDLGDDDPYRALADRNFDVVCQFLAFTPEQVRRDIEFFGPRCGQYVFVSSAAVYAKPCNGPVREANDLGNTFWEYGRKKAECEAALNQAAQSGQMAATIVRPSHTYRNQLPGAVVDGNHQAWRILQGKAIVVHDDGESLWTLTHADDFARAFVGLCGNPAALGETVHITSNEAPTWNHIVDQFAASLGVAPKICYVSTARMVDYDARWEGPLWGDKTNSLIFDNSKVSGLLGDWECQVTLAEGLPGAARATLALMDSGYSPDPDLDRLLDTIVQDAMIKDSRADIQRGTHRYE